MVTIVVLPLLWLPIISGLKLFIIFFELMFDFEFFVS